MGDTVVVEVFCWVARDHKDFNHFATAAEHVLYMNNILFSFFKNNKFRFLILLFIFIWFYMLYQNL